MIRLCIIFLILSLSLTACSTSEEKEGQVNALVKTEKLHQKEIKSTLEFYGQFSPNYNANTISFPQPVQIANILINPGDEVKKGALLLELNLDPSSTLSYRQAVLQYQTTQTSMQHTEHLFSLQLATKSQMDAASQALADAKAALEVQKQQGNDLNRQQIRMPFDGIVLSIAARNGDRVPPGTSVLQVVAFDNLVVLGGVEPNEGFKIKVGMPVQLSSVFSPIENFTGTIGAVGSVVDPTTHLVNLVVKIDGRQQRPHLIAGAAVKGAIILTDQKEWVIPKSAVLQDAKGSYIYQVIDGKAKRVPVKIILEKQNLAAISGPFNPEKAVVIMGNYELEDGMAVHEGTNS